MLASARADVIYPKSALKKCSYSDASAHISRRKDGSRHDQDPTCPPHGKKTGNEQQDRGGVPGTPGGNRNQGNEEKRRVRDSWPGPPRKVQPESPHGTQSANRRTHQNRGQDRGKVPRCQGRERRNRSQEITPFNPSKLQRPAEMSWPLIMSLRSNPLVSNDSLVVLLRLMQAARRASRARCLVSELIIMSLRSKPLVSNDSLVF